MQLLVGWTECFVVNGSLMYKRCPPTTPICQPSRILPPGYNRNPTLPVWTEAHVSTETNINQARAQPMPCLEQHLLYLRLQAFLKLPKLRRCEAPCQKPKEAPREGTRSTAMPLATQGDLLTPLNSTTICRKKSTSYQMPQDTATLHPQRMSRGVHGAPKTVAPTIIQPSTALC